MTIFGLALGSTLSGLLAPTSCDRKQRAAATCLALAACMCTFAEIASAQSKTATSTTVAITSGGNAVSLVAAGSVVTLTAQVNAGGTAVTPGQVNFCDASAKTCTDIHLLGTAQLTGAGTATLNLRPGIGSHTYKAVFRGTKTYASSASAASALTATGSFPPLATITGINETGSWGAYTLSATVTETGNTAPPTGTVSFLDTNHGNAVLGTGTLGAAMRGVSWSNVDTSAPNLAGVSTAVADLNGDGIPDLFIEDYFGTYNVLLGNGDGTFKIGASTFGPTSQTGSFILGDFNNDGIPDVAAIDAVLYGASNTITIFLGNGDGTFTVAGTSPAIGYNPTAIATADINGDGNADLIVVQQGSSTSSNAQVVVFLGNGEGTFAEASSTTSISSPVTTITPTDINNDGNIDLVLGNGATILLGNGDGTFTVVPGPAGQGSVSVADVNNDGFPDLVFGGAAPTSYLAVFLGNGDGTFTAVPAGSNPQVPIGGMAIGDLNQDGIPDIVYAIPGTTEIGLLIGKGDGTFVQTAATATYGYDFSGNIVVADFNGDGWPDVLTVDSSGRTVEDSLTQPTETATASSTVSVAAPGAHLANASYSGDSNYTSSASATIALWGVPPATSTSLMITSNGTAVSSVGPGTLVTLTATVISGGSPLTAGEVNFCDATAASCSDIHLLGSVSLSSNGTAAFKLVPGPGTHSYKAVFPENGYGLSSSSVAATLTVGPAPAAVYSDTVFIGAMGSPGDYSLLGTVIGYGGSAAPTGTISFLDTSFGNTSLGGATLGSATGGVGWLISQTPSLAGANPIGEAAGDFNGDGIPDLAVLWSANVSGGPDSITILFGTAGGSFTQGPTIQGQTGQTYLRMIAGDFNGDGKTDLVLLDNSFATTDTVTTYLGNGDGTFGPATTSVVYQQSSTGGDYVPGSMVAADLNGDGKLDLAVVGNYISSGGVTILLGNGDGTFSAAGPNQAPNKDFGLVATGDFNGDGIPDLVVTNYFEDGTSPTIFLGKGDGTYTAMPASFTLDYFPTSIVVGDFNGDGVLDLAFSDLNGVEIALGNGDGTFKETSASPIAVPSELYSLTLGDFNHDGKLDIAGLDNYNDRIVLLIGAGDGTFTVTATTPVVSQDWLGPFAIVAADFNQDGVPDLAMLTKNQATASILLTVPTETATATLTGVAPVGPGTHNVEASYPGDSNYPAEVSATTPLTAGLKPLTITPAGGTFSSIQTVTISEAIPGATIYYQASGAFYTSGFVQYTGPISLNIGGVETITAYATETGYDESSYTTVTFSLNFPVAPAPVISPSGGEFAGSKTVTITDTASPASIYYTTDGTWPTANSTIYAGPITVSTSGTVAAIAAGGGFSPSPLATSQFFIQSSTSRFIYTVAGSGFWGLGGDGGPAPQAILNNPTNTAIDAAGNLYIVDSGNQLVRKVDAATGTISTVAGSGVGGYSGDGGPATKAELYSPWGVAVDSAGDLYISDSGNYVVRRVDATSGTISTVAGTGTSGTSGDGGPATQALLSYPAGIALDAAGNLYIGDQARVRMVNAGTGVIKTVAGSGAYGFSGDGGPATSASLTASQGLALDTSGNLYIADAGNNAIRKVTAATGIINTVAGQGGYTGMGYSGDGGAATSAKLSYPAGVGVDAAGNVYIADTDNYVLREVTAADGNINTISGRAGFCTTLSGDGGPANLAGICYAPGVALDGQGNLYVAEEGFNRIRKIMPASAPPSNTTAEPAFSVVAGSYVTSQTLTITDATPGAEIYVTVGGTGVGAVGQGYFGPIEITGSSTIQAVAVAPGYLPSTALSAAYNITTPPTAIINTFAGNGTAAASGIGGPATGSGVGYPTAIASDQAGNLYIVDQDNAVVWKVSGATGTITIAAGIPGVHSFQTAAGPAASTALDFPQQVAVDQAGNLYISDFGFGRVLKVDAATGMMSVFAGGGTPPVLGDGGPATQAYLSPSGLAVDQAGNLYIGDTANGRIRKVTLATGIITTVAGGGTSGRGDGGPATAATLVYPGPIVFDSKGNLYIGDGTGRVRVVNAQTAIITTFAGNGNRGGTGDGGPATAAEINASGLAVDSADNLYISNAVGAIRVVQAGGGTITRVIGIGYSGFGGDGGAASMAEVCGPDGLAFDQAGSLYIADSCNNRVRKVTYPGPAATPAFSLAAGAYSGAQTVTIADATPGAAIYYTTDGSTPTTGSTAYTAPITVSSSETVKAIAASTGYTVSAVASVDYVIKPLPDVGAVQSSLNPSLTGNAVTFTVSVSSSAGSPSGSVTFMDGTAQLGSETLSSGSATYTTSALSAGSHSITGLYSGDATFASVTSAALTQVVESFSITPSSGSSSSATVSPGGQATYSLAVTPPAAGAALTFSISGLPAGATGTFSPSTVAAGGGATNVTLTISVPASAAVLPVEQPFDRGTWPVALGLVLLPFARRLGRKGRGWMPQLLLTAAGLMIGFGVSACGGSGTKTPPPQQTYALTVTATSGTLTQSTTLTLVVE
jgi:sugar lactone lactonase YvrE